MFSASTKTMSNPSGTRGRDDGFAVARSSGVLAAADLERRVDPPQQIVR